MPEPSGDARQSRSIPRVSLHELWAFLAILLPVLGSLLAPLSTVDLAYHLRVGGIVLDTGALPVTDSFTFTAAGQPWLDQQWGAQVILAAIYRAGGWALLAVVRAAVVGLVAWLVFRACRSSGAGLRVAAWLTLAGFAVSLVALGMRPQLFGMVLFAAVLAILAGRERHPRLVWAVPVLVAVWASIHGSFVFGPAAVAVVWLGDLVEGRPRPHRLLVVVLLSAGATLLNPYGIGAWSYAAGLTTNPLIRRLITEWQVTTPLSFVGAAFYGSVVASVVLVALAARHTVGGVLGFLRWTWPTLVWLLGLAAVGAFAERGVAWWAVGAPVALAGLLGSHVADRPVSAPLRSRANTAIVVVLGLAIVVLLPIWRGGDPRYGPPGLLTEAPKGITDALLAIARPTDRIWNAQRWGSWLEFAVPDTPIAVDSRIELVPADAWDDHLALSRGASDWQAILDRRGVTIVVAAADEQKALIPLLRASSAWRSVLHDGEGAVFARTRP
jgi:hypothetical protein